MVMENLLVVQSIEGWDKIHVYCFSLIFDNGGDIGKTGNEVDAGIGDDEDEDGGGIGDGEDGNAELRFVATVTTSGCVKFVPAV